jgi:GalNAc-alpha-(1->4)-GalNAc-alpha-(1->3)-diNAcBac-PP-undecaprenol alpha-1,4-N-acetyl-D-galactosaminyltransferase
VKKKRLCLVIPSLQAGGMERVMSELAGYFCSRKELEVHLVLYGRSPEFFYEVPNGLEIHDPQSVFDNRLRFYYTIRRILFIRKTIRGIKPHSVLSFGEYWNSFVLLALTGLPFPVFISDRCSPANNYSTLHNFLRRWLYPKAKGIIAQTEMAKVLYQRQFNNDNIVVIGNPIMLSAGHEGPRHNTVLTVGRLIASKNHDKIIELFCRINKPDWRLLIVGGNALKQDNMLKLTALVRSLNAESKVEITGYRNSMDEIYRQSSIFVLASESEGFPNVIGEAMSAGIPVVAFDCVAGPSEMITDGEDGYLVPVGNYDEFAERLENLMEDVTLRQRMGLMAKASIRRFAVDIVGAEYYNLLIRE